MHGKPYLLVNFSSFLLTLKKYLSYTLIIAYWCFVPTVACGFISSFDEQSVGKDARFFEWSSRPDRQISPGICC